jgi:dephospho-CoA kinase
MFKVGLTGGIGSGKSSVAHFFQQLGAYVLDADDMARWVVDPSHSEGLAQINQIEDYFGPQYGSVLQADQSLDRAKLRNIIFSEPKHKTWLEQQLHPKIQIQTEQRFLDAKNHGYPYYIWVVPLLLEHNLQSKVDRVLVIDAPEIIQIQRVTQRDNTKAEQVAKIIQAQITRENRLKLADDIISNNDALDMIKPKIELLHEKYKQLAKLKK